MSVTAAEVLDVASVLRHLAVEYGVDTDPGAGPLMAADLRLIAEGVNNDWNTYDTARAVAERNGWAKRPGDTASTLKADVDKAVFTYDDGGRDVRGAVEVRRDPYGPTLWVNGRVVGYIDLFTAESQQHPRLVVDHPTETLNAAIVTFRPDGEVVVEVDPDGQARKVFEFKPDADG